MRRRLVLGVLGLSVVTSAARAAILPRRESQRLRLVNAHTGETFEGPYRTEAGPITRAMDELSVFLRDFRTGARTDIDVGVLDFLSDVMGSVGATKATVLSAYRTPETNEMLARTTFGVAEHSQHLYGRALDFSLDTKLTEAMLVARAMRRGGVGWYPNSGFIHLDTGPVRIWSLGDRGLGQLLFDKSTPMPFSEIGEATRKFGSGSPPFLRRLQLADKMLKQP